MKICDICEKEKTEKNFLKTKQICRNCASKCKHNKRKQQCKICKGSSICEHNIRKERCKKCKGGSICIHNNNKYNCKKCNGTGICIHNIDKSYCKKCDGSSICIHKKYKKYCKECGGSAYCEHNIRKRTCRICDFPNYLQAIIRSRIHNSIKKNPNTSTIKYLGCDMKFYKKYLENKFKNNMTWDNLGILWHIDHIIPLKYNSPTVEEQINRLHYTNTQPLYIDDNLKKGNRYIG